MLEMTRNTEELVSSGFANLMSILNRFGDDIKLQCAEATINGELERSGALLEESKSMLAFRREVEALSMRWSKGQMHLPTAACKNHQSQGIGRKMVLTTSPQKHRCV